MLYLAESEHPSCDHDKWPRVSIAARRQYVLGDFATARAAVTKMRKERFRLVSIVAPNSKKEMLYLSISDSSGDSAILGISVENHGFIIAIC